MLADGGSLALADALPPYFISGGCLAAVIVLLLQAWRMLCRRSFTLADALPPWSCYSVDASAPFRASCLLSLGIFGGSISSLCKFSSPGGLCLGGKFGVSSLFVLLLLCSWLRPFVCLSVLFFSVSLSLVLCALVLVKLCLTASRLCL